MTAAAFVSLWPLLLLELVVLVIAPVLEVSDGEEGRPEMPVVDNLVLQLGGQVLEEARHHSLLVGGNVLLNLTVDASVSLPPLVKT